MDKNAAHVVSLEDIEKSVNISDNFKKCFVTPTGVELEEVNVIGVVADSPSNEKEYLLVKDKTGECYIKMIWQNQTKEIKEGTILHVIGFLNFNGQKKYINPYIVKKIEENPEERQKLRELEIIEFCNYIDKNKEKFSSNTEKYKYVLEKIMKGKKDEKAETIEHKENGDEKEITEINIIDIIKQLDKEDKGVSYVDVLDKFSDEQREAVETVIYSLLDEGLCYEPIAGKIKVL